MNEFSHNMQTPDGEETGQEAQQHPPALSNADQQGMPKEEYQQELPPGQGGYQQYTPPGSYQQYGYQAYSQGQQYGYQQPYGAWTCEKSASSM